MKKFKSLFAMLLAIVVALSFTACHPKDELAATITDPETGKKVNITTAQYLYAMVSAVQEANTLIDEAQEDEEEIKDYTKYKVEETNDEGKTTKTEYEKWVNNKIDENLRATAIGELYKDIYKLELTEEEESSISSYAQMYWSYGVQATFEKNGIGLETYEKIMKGDYYKEEYFKYLYDKEGKKAVAEKDIESFCKKNYALANVLSISIAEETDEESEGTEATETQKTTITLKEAKSLLKSYKEKLESGDIAFVDAYVEVMEVYDGETLESKKNDAGTYDEDVAETVLGSDKTSYSDEKFDTVSDMKVGSYKIITAEDKSAVYLVEKLNLEKEYAGVHTHEEGEEHHEDEEETPFYETFRSDILHALKDEEFEEENEKFQKTLKIETTSAVNRLKIKKIDLSTEE